MTGDGGMLLVVVVMTGWRPVVVAVVVGCNDSGWRAVAIVVVG